MDLKEFEKNIGFTLYEWQYKGIKSLNGKNKVLVEAPTSSGKTILAIYMVLDIIEQKNSHNNFILFITPLNQLVKEHVKTLKSFIKVPGINITSNFKTLAQHSKNILVITPEQLFDQITSLNTYLFNIDLLIIDEIHLVGSQNRGPIFELSISLLLMFSSKAIALSATMGDIKKMSLWVNADRVINSTFRMIDVSTEIILYGKNANKKILNLVENFTYQTIIFRGRVDFTESTAAYLAKNSTLDNKTRKELKNLIPIKYREKWITNSDKKWLGCFESGYPYHHAKIRPKQK